MNIKAIKEIALANVKSPSPDYFQRFLARWYSNTFSTPLHYVISSISSDELLLHYFEYKFENMPKKDLNEHMMDVVDPDWRKKEEQALKEFIEAEMAESQSSKVSGQPQSVTRSYDLDESDADENAGPTG